MITRRAWAYGLILMIALSAAGAFAVQALSQEPPRPVVVPTAESGALAHFAAANAAAAAWRGDAVLVRLGATEGPQLDARIDPPFLWDTRGDAWVGNGQALVWTFTYASPDVWDRSFWVSIGGDGSLLYARELLNPYYCCVEAVAAHPAVTPAHGETRMHHGEDIPARPEMRPLSAGIDAPAAVAIIADRPEFVNFSLDHPVFQAQIDLVAGPENQTAWLIGYRTATFYGAFAAVDAHSGELLHVGSWPYRPDHPPCCEPQPPIGEPCCRPDDLRASYAGTLDAWGSYEVSFPVDNAWWLQSLRVVATVGESPLDERYVLTLHDDRGRILERVEGAGELAIERSGVPVSGFYHAYIHRVSDLGYVHLLPAEDTAVQVELEVLYADAPQPRPMEYTYHGDAWPGEQWFDLAADGEGWTPLAPAQVTLTWEQDLPMETLELVLLDQWGNEIAHAKGDELATGVQSITIDVADPAPGLMASIRAPNTGIYLGGTTPFELHVVYQTWDGEAAHGPGHGGIHH